MSSYGERPAVSATDVPIDPPGEEGCGPCAPGRLIDPEEAEFMAARLKALADPGRLQISRAATRLCPRVPKAATALP
ncbi:hypothetical protein [Streptomyces sp. NPDC054887]